jgi:SAM-dependent methyltransferase
MMNPLPPGTILQLMYLRERLKNIPAGRFVEIGPGAGEITGLLLGLGWKGTAYDLEDKTIDNLRSRFSGEIAEGRLVVENDNYIMAPAREKVDLVISCMVMEHMEDADVMGYMKVSASRLAEGGLMINLVPASPKHWGIEDEIAGHCRRYTRDALRALMSATGWRLAHIKGLTYPVSNLLLPISNFLVNRGERHKLSLSAAERTRHSGRRSVRFKTHFPSVFGLLLNRFTIFPLHLLQKACGDCERTLILYFEAKPIRPGTAL